MTVLMISARLLWEEKSGALPRGHPSGGGEVRLRYHRARREEVTGPKLVRLRRYPREEVRASPAFVQSNAQGGGGERWIVSGLPKGEEETALMLFLRRFCGFDCDRLDH